MLSRTRRIKCGEEEPSCKQCLRGRRKCDGYPQKSLPVGREIIQVLFLTPPPSAPLLKTNREARSLDFFRRRTIPQLAGTFKSQFWEFLLLQAIHHEPAVQHAAVALGSAHEHFEISSNLSEKDQEFSLQQYVRAIKLVASPTTGEGRQAADVALMTCAIFVCFEVKKYKVS